MQIKRFASPVFSLAVTLSAFSVLAAPKAHATLDGLYDPYGRAGNPEVVSAVWDTFTEVYSSGAGASTLYTYTGNTTGTPTFTGLTLTKTNPSTAAPGAGVGAQGRGLVQWDGSAWGSLPSNLGTSDGYYSSTGAASWTLEATTSIDIESMTFQIKLNTTSSDPGSGFTGITSGLYLPTLNGVEAAVYVSSQDSGTVYSGSGPTQRNFWVIEYQWTDLDIQAGDSLQIDFALAGGNSGAATRRVVDFVALDGTSVPEPTVCALVGLGLGASLLRRRRVAR
jgi:hypothetical protein